jgi:thiol:disulfide interchange protein DsbG
VKRRACLAAAAAAVVALAACSKQEGGAPSAAPAAGTTPVSLEKIASDAKGFNVGSTMSTRVVYVFFDAQCPHCATLWESAKGLGQSMRVVWIPVRALGPASLAMGAAILSAPDPAAAMDEHEKIRAAGGRGIDVATARPGAAEKVQANTALFLRLGANAVPLIFYKDAAGMVRTQEGALDPRALRTLLGV